MIQIQASIATERKRRSMQKILRSKNVNFFRVAQNFSQVAAAV